MITAEQAQNIHNREDALTMWLDGRNGYFTAEAIAAGLNPPTSDELSSVEVFDFVTNPPDRYFIYVTRPKTQVGCTLDFQRTVVTTFTGEKLGEAHLGEKFVSNFGDERYSITVRGINGKKYVGTYYAGAGDYARIRLAKDQTL